MRLNTNLRPMNLFDKPLFTNSKVGFSSSCDDNKVLVKFAKIGGKEVKLNFVIRSEKDVVSSRNTSYQLLVP